MFWNKPRPKTIRWESKRAKGHSNQDFVNQVNLSNTYKLEADILQQMNSSIFKFQFQVSISIFNFKFQFQDSISSFNFKFQFRGSNSSIISSFNYKFQFQVSISSYNFKFQFQVLIFQFQVSIACFNFKFQFQVSVSSFSFKFQFQVSDSSFKFQCKSDSCSNSCLNQSSQGLSRLQSVYFFFYQIYLISQKQMILHGNNLLN